LSPLDVEEGVTRMGKRTEENMKAAFAGESQAHVKYLVFADRAEREGMSRIAALFRAASFAEQVHATTHLKVLKGVGSTADNLEAAIQGETYEFTEMYPDFEATAVAEEEKGAQRSIQWAMSAEIVHAALYKRAKEAASSGVDAEMGPIFVCGSCGHTHEGEEAPEKCPLCGAARERFVAF
jgi:rubrerythrin